MYTQDKANLQTYSSEYKQPKKYIWITPIIVYSNSINGRGLSLYSLDSCFPLLQTLIVGNVSNSKYMFFYLKNINLNICNVL